jgi:hypothetical protein
VGKNGTKEKEVPETYIGGKARRHGRDGLSQIDWLFLPDSARAAGWRSRLPRTSSDQRRRQSGYPRMLTVVLQLAHSVDVSTKGQPRKTQRVQELHRLPAGPPRKWLYRLAILWATSFFSNHVLSNPEFFQWV